MATTESKTTTTTQSATTMATQSTTGLDVVLPYIGDAIYTNVSKALADRDVEKEFNDKFNEQHSRNVQASRGDVANIGNTLVSGSASTSTTAMMFATLMQPMAANSYMAKLMAPVPQTPIVSNQQTTNQQQQQPNSTQQQTIQQLVGNTSSGVVTAAGGVYVSSTNGSYSGKPSIRFNDPLSGMDTNDTKGRDEQYNLLQRFSDVVKFSTEMAYKKMNARRGRIMPSSEDATDQTLNRELRNEQFKDIGFKNQVSKIKDKLALKFLQKWDEGGIKFGGSDDTQPKDESSWLTKLAIPGLVAFLMHNQFGVTGDKITAFGGRILSSITGQGRKLINKFSEFAGTKAGKLAEKSLKASKAVDAASDASKVSKITSKAVTTATKGVLAPVSGAMRTVGVVGKALTPLAGGMVALSGGMDVYKNIKEGNTRGAVSSGVGTAVDTFMTVAGGLTGGALSIGGDFLVNKLSGGQMKSVGDAFKQSIDVGFAIADDGEESKERAENTKSMMDSSTINLLKSRARVAIKNRPELGDADIITTKFFGTDRANESITKLHDAIEHYYDASSVLGQLKPWGDNQQEAQAKMDKAQKSVVDLFDEFISTYDPNKMHDWEFETQARIQAEAETAELEAAETEVETGGTVGGASNEIFDDHEYQPQFDAETMQQAMKNGAEATLLDPRFHALMRDDMAVIGQQINTQLTG